MLRGEEAKPEGELSPAGRWYRRHAVDPEFRAAYNAKKRVERAGLTPEEKRRRIAAQLRTPEQRARHSQWQSRKAKRRREWIDSLKQGRPCLDCGKQFPPYVMDFDHRPGTNKAHAVMSCISMLATRARPEVVLDEIAKCDLVCSNCHRERTQQRSPGRMTRKTQQIIRERKAVPCADCCERYAYYMMDFDHRDREDKACVVSRLASRGSMQAVLDEIAKCDVICSNCHRERTHRRRKL